MNTNLYRRFDRIHKHTARTVMVLVLGIFLALGASAQRGVHYGGGSAIVHGGGGYYHGGGGYFYHPRTYVGIGFGWGWPYYSPFYYPYGGFYGPWYPYPYYGYRSMPSKLALQIEDIKNDYDEQIQAAKDDKSMTRRERRQRVRELKHDREAAIIQAQRDYYYNNYKHRNGTNGNGQDNTKPQDNNNPPSSSPNEQPEYSEKVKPSQSGNPSQNGSGQ